jgi:hypothetical protein
MIIKYVEFSKDQKLAVNTYVSAMKNACKVVLSHIDESDREDTFFNDFVTLAEDETVNKVSLANEMIKEVSKNHGNYLRGDFAYSELPSGQYLWFINIHNKAIETAKVLLSYWDSDLTWVKNV